MSTNERSEMTTTELKPLPCPFCGSEPEITTWGADTRTGAPFHQIECGECGCSIGHSSEPLATHIDNWNTRRTAAHGEPSKADFHEDGLGLAVFIVLRPGKIPRIGRPSKDIVASLREWFASNPDADIYVIRSWSDEVGCQSIENGRELLQMEGDDVPSQEGSAEQVKVCASVPVIAGRAWHPGTALAVQGELIQAIRALSAPAQAQSEDAK